MKIVWILQSRKRPGGVEHCKPCCIYWLGTCGGCVWRVKARAGSFQIDFDHGQKGLELRLPRSTLQNALKITAMLRPRHICGWFNFIQFTHTTTTVTPWTWSAPQDLTINLLSVISSPFAPHICRPVQHQSHGPSPPSHDQNCLPGSHLSSASVILSGHSTNHP